METEGEIVCPETAFHFCHIAGKHNLRTVDQGDIVTNLFNRRHVVRGKDDCVSGIFEFEDFFFQQFGIQYTTVGKTGFITACYIVIIPIFGLFLKKKCTPFIWLSVLLALVGLYFCVSQPNFLLSINWEIFWYFILCNFVFIPHPGH